MQKKIIILTKSWKNGGYCVAGIDIETKKLVRLVSGDKKSCGALAYINMITKNEEIIEPLDLVEITIKNETPLEFQPENILIDVNESWKKIKRYNNINEAINDCKFEDLNCDSNVFYNISSYLNREEISKINKSLMLILVNNLYFHFKEYNEKKKTKASFIYNKQQYDKISVTDPDYSNKLPEKEIEKAILVVSLPSDPFKTDTGDRYYKFVAKVFEL